ncbi:hypothetical protein [Altererythrobacter sp. GH1-8]|uniref:hypothetical protein n=1 Tax=Altererythrobacter sp. GH1-8 TaxID=3349333 RepID=UPI00374D8937
MDWARHEREIIRIIAALEKVDATEIKGELLDGQLVEMERRLRSGAERISDPKTKKKLLEMTDEHARLREIRNDIVHGLWSGLNEHDRFVHRRKKRGQLETSSVFGAKEIIAERDAILAINGQTFELLRLLGVLPMPEVK